MKNIFNRIISKIGINNKPEEWQLKIVNEVRNYTMTSNTNIIEATNAVKHICRNNIKGDMVECGVWKGGSLMAVALALNHFNKTDRFIYAYDTYDLFPAAEKIDVSIDGKFGDDVVNSLAEDGVTWKAPDIVSVKENLISTGYPADKFLLVKGDVLETIPQTIPQHIALLRLDTDWYKSTLYELEWLYPRVSKNGIIIIDDYGGWQGSKKATDFYFKKNKVNPKLKFIDSSAVMFKK